jgi:hypothetical protein
MLLMSVLLAAVCEYSLIFTLGISYSVRMS